MRAAKYRRISDDREGRELGVTRQDEDLDKLAGREGLTVVADYCDDDIGASTRSRKDRPEYHRMLADAKAGRFDVIIAYTSSRLTRRPRELEDQIELAEKYGIRFLYDRSPSFDLNTSAGRRIARMLAASDAAESEDISERVARQKKQASAAGEWKGGKRPFGYEANGVTIRKAEARVVQQMAEQVLAGATLRGLARDLNQRGVLTSTGRQWSVKTIRQVMRRPRNAGLVEYRGEVLAGVAAQWPGILDEQTWRAVCAILEDPARMTNPIIPGRKYLLSKIALCGVCRKPVGTKAVRTDGRPRGYTCPDHHVFRRIDFVDALVEHHMIRRLQRPDAADLVAEDDGEARELHSEATVLRQRLDALAEAFAAGEIDGAQMSAGTRTLRARMDTVTAALAEAARRSVLGGLAGADDVGERWHADLPLDRKRRIIASLAEVVILPIRRDQPTGWSGGSIFDPEKVQVIWRV